jgi:hypothetical protein
LASGADRGLPARNSPTDYPVHTKQAGITIAAEALDAEQLRNAFSTNLRRYLVLEVAVYPAAGQTLALSGMDFALKEPGRPLVRPASARSIANINQKRTTRNNDILLYPTVGVGVGSGGGYGTSTGVGVGVGVGSGGGSPAPASTDRDREVMQLELEEKGLPESNITKPTAGYLFFPVGEQKKKTGSYHLEYHANGSVLVLELPVPKTR